MGWCRRTSEKSEVFFFGTHHKSGQLQSPASEAPKPRCSASHNCTFFFSCLISTNENMQSYKTATVPLNDDYCSKRYCAYSPLILKLMRNRLYHCAPPIFFGCDLRNYHCVWLSLWLKSLHFDDRHLVLSHFLIKFPVISPLFVGITGILIFHCA